MTQAEIDAEKVILQARLDSIDAAILNAIEAQSYSAYGRSKSMADISKLEALRDSTKSKIESLKRGNRLMIKRGIPSC